MMKSYPCCCVALLVAALCIVDIVKAGELEVEVTRTPEECNRKSQEGDSLTMHYTVCCLLLLYNFLFIYLIFYQSSCHEFFKKAIYLDTLEKIDMMI